MIVADLIGKKFFRWTVLKRVSNSDNNHIRFECLCECGNTGLVNGSQLRNGRSKSCGCYAVERTKIRNRKAPFEGIFNILNHHAKRRDIEITLTYLEFLEFTKVNKCHYCGDGIVWKPHQIFKETKRQRYNLDRKDNNIGYTKDNCVVCCSECNFTKGTRFTYDEMLILGRTIAEIKHRRLGDI